MRTRVPIGGIAMDEDSLVIVDPQNDFCDQRGSLYVDGAAADIKRLSDYIKRHGRKIGNIFVSLDSHDSVAIFHPSFWRNNAGERPRPFTGITGGDFRARKWTPPRGSEQAVERTFAAMERKGETEITVWPEHCVVSTWGHQIADTLRDALADWRQASSRAVRYIFKGENPYTDQYSIFEGLDDTYPETAYNVSLLEKFLAAGSTLTFAGEALSHCVLRSIASYMPRRPDGCTQAVRLLADCTSPVAGFSRDEALGTLSAMGVKIVSSV